MLIDYRATWDWLTRDASGAFTCLLVLVGVVQVFVFLKQLRLIRDSLLPAKEAAEAAKESAKVAHRAIDETEKRDKVLQRAYLWPGFGLVILDKNNTRMGIHVGIRNTGRTAGIVKTVHHALVSKEDWDAKKIVTYKVYDGREDVIAPDANTEVRSGVWYRLNIMPKISCGWITYIDVFETEWRQGWAHEISMTGRTESLPGCYTNEPWKTEHREKPSDQESLPPESTTKELKGPA
jgi:hypothetical protein